MPRDLFMDEQSSFKDLDPRIGHAAAELAAPARWLRTTPCWALSALVHLALVVFFLLMVTEERRAIDSGPAGPIQVDVPRLPGPAEPPAYDPLARRSATTQRQRPVPAPVLAAVEDPLRLEKEFNEDKFEVKIPQGADPRELTDRQIAELASGFSGKTSDVIGPGTGAAGDRGVPWGQDGRLKRENAPPASEDAVYAALLWLVRHQSADGSWKSRDYTETCAETCRNLEPRYGDGRGFPHHDVGVTGLAILAMAGYGHTHQSGEYEEFSRCVKNAVGYLKRVQVRSSDPATNGRYGGNEADDWIYDHAIATMAMSELLIMSNDIIGLKASVSDAAKLCLHAQNEGRGWRYGVRDGENDSSVSGWMVLALKTAKAAGLDIPEADFDRAFAGALHWFNSATTASGKTGYLGPGDPGSQLVSLETGGVYPYSKDLSCMTAVGVLCRIFSGESRKSDKVRGGVQILMEHTPRWQEQRGRLLSTINLYYWYYGSYALFQYGGKEWTAWNEAMLKALIENQRQGAIRPGEPICEDGSWDPIDEWGTAGGRVYATALGAMTLEVYYRFRRL